MSKTPHFLSQPWDNFSQSSVISVPFVTRSLHSSPLNGKKSIWYEVFSWLHFWTQFEFCNGHNRTYIQSICRHVNTIKYHSMELSFKPKRQLISIVYHNKLNNLNRLREEEKAQLYYHHWADQPKHLQSRFLIKHHLLSTTLVVLVVQELQITTVTFSNDPKTRSHQARNQRIFSS